MALTQIALVHLQNLGRFCLWNPKRLSGLNADCNIYIYKILQDNMVLIQIGNFRLRNPGKMHGF